MTCCSLIRAGLFIGALCLIQGNSDIGCPSARAQTVGELVVQHIDNRSERRSKSELIPFCPDDLNVATSTCIFPKVVKGWPDSGEFGANDSYYLAGLEQDYWCSGYALYRYTLEVNNLSKLKIPECERSLRRYRASQAKRWNGVTGCSECGAEWQSDDGDWGTFFDIDLIAKNQGGEVLFGDFKNRKISESCQIIKWGDNLGWNLGWMSEQGYGDASTANQRVRVGYNVQGSYDPAVRINDKPSATHRPSRNFNHRTFELSAGLDLGKWLRDVLAIKCGAGSQHDKNVAQPHEATPSVGEAH